MKKKKLLRNTFVVTLVLAFIAILIFLQISYCLPYNYVKNCFLSNKEDFEQLLYYLRSQYNAGTTHIRVDEHSNSDEIKAILNRLREQYQNDNEYSVFYRVDAYYDNDGDLLFYLCAKSEKIKGADGIDDADIRSYYLVYIDENYSAGTDSYSSYIKKITPFYDNWFTWASDNFSG